MFVFTASAQENEKVFVNSAEKVYVHICTSTEVQLPRTRLQFVQCIVLMCLYIHASIMFTKSEESDDALLSTLQ